MKMKLVSIIACALSVTFFVSCGRGRQEKEIIPEFVFFYAENQSEDYPTTLGAYKFAELVEERTMGRIKIIVQPEAQMGYEKQVIEQLQYGGIDFVRVSLSQLAEFMPKLNVLQMPYLYTDANHMWRVLESEIGKNFLSSMEEAELIGLSWYDAGARSFYNSVRPIYTLEDMQGLTIRVQESEVMEDMVEALGAKAVPIVYDEVYSSLELGIVDGAENNWPSYESMRHCEVAKYITLDEQTRVPEMQLCAKATWDKLTEEDREIIRGCAQESALYERDLWIKREEESEKIAIERGVEVVELSMEEKHKFQKAVEGIYEKYCLEDMKVIDEIIAMGNE